jgi:CheY-like chemotaxis protein
VNTILIVDDSPIDQRFAGRLLEKTNQFQVTYAANGRDALDLIDRDAPDLVVTDLQMPEMDGLELVDAVRSQFPLVPVILMTAYGSEDIAVKALVNGAAGYVPKADLKTDLLSCIEGVLSLSQAGRSHQHLRSAVAYSETHFHIGPDPTLLAPLVDQLQQMVMAMGVVDETGRIRLAIAFEEVILHGFYRGNLELTADQVATVADPVVQELVANRCEEQPYSLRTLCVQLKLSKNEARLVVRDEGPGFDFAQLPDAHDPANLQNNASGKLMLTRMFMDAVEFVSDNEITLVKYRRDE